MQKKNDQFLHRNMLESICNVKKIIFSDQKFNLTQLKINLTQNLIVSLESNANKKLCANNKS